MSDSVRSGVHLWATIQTSVDTTPRPCRDTMHFCTAGSFELRGEFAGWRVLTIAGLLMSGCGQGCELTPTEQFKEALAPVFSAISQPK